jgi:flagellar biogenesis protein FliO
MSAAMLNDSELREVGHASAGVAQGDLWQRARVWCQRMLRSRLRPQRRLRLCESLPLGERRFVAVVEFERSRFLVGGTSASLVLLARLGQADDEAPSPAHDATETPPGARR